MNKIILLFVLGSFLFVSSVFSQELMSIAEVQGDKYVSSYAGKKVKIQGIVTGMRKRGFFIQTPDDKTDDNPKTSEGIFVFTLDPPASNVKIGKLIEVSGFVKEYRPEREKYALFITEIVKPSIKVISKDNPLPKAILLQNKDLHPKGAIDQLERFEGMRVKIDELNVVAPTGGFHNRKEDKVVSDGVFFGVISNTPRPFREPGLDGLMALLAKLPKTLPLFDTNPELLRVDSDGLNGGIPIDVTSGAKIKNLIGVIDYSFRRYTLLIDPNSNPTVENNQKFVSASPAGEREITIASFNLENFFDDEKNSNLKRKETRVSKEHFEKRLKKTSLAIRNVISMPDILGIVEVENLTVLKKLAERINSDAVANNQPNPKYEAYLKESNDLRGIDVGFLVKTSKIKALKTQQLGKDLKLEHKDANENETLFSRPPFLIEAEVLDEKSDSKFQVTVIINHFKSYRGIDDEKNADRVRNKRRMQAEFLADFVQKRQTKNPKEKIVVLGDFNVFQFSDGYSDLIGVLTGKANKNVLAPSTNVYQTNLINLVNHIAKTTRYSYIFGGSAQTLDHILISKSTITNAKKFGYARLNADFPKVYANDETRPERVSDHDVPILYLSLDGKKPKSETKEGETK